MTREVLQQALQYVESNSFGGSDTLELIVALKAALAQPEQERDIANLIAGTLCVSRGTAYEMMREALEEAQPELPTIEQSLIVEGEPVAWSTDIEFDDDTEIILPEEKGRLGTAGMTIPLYTSPPKRQPLTDEQIEAVYENASGQELRPQDYRIVLQFARAIEAAHGIGDKK